MGTNDTPPPVLTQPEINITRMVQNRTNHLPMKPYEHDSGVRTPIGAADFHGFANRICEGTEQIHITQ